MKKSELKLERERRLKKEMPIEAEKIEYAGAEGKEGIKWAKEILGAQEKKEQEKRLQNIEDLSKLKRVDSYNHALYDMLRGFLSIIPFPNWRYRVAYTKEGIIMELQSPYGKFYRSAFKSTGIPEYDVNAVQVFAIRAENTIDRVEGRDGANRGKGSPNSEDTRVRGD